MNFPADNDLVIVIITTEGGGCVRTRVSEAESVICLGKDMYTSTILGMLLYCYLRCYYQIQTRQLIQKYLGCCT